MNHTAIITGEESIAGMRSFPFPNMPKTNPIAAVTEPQPQILRNKGSVVRNPKRANAIITTAK